VWSVPLVAKLFAAGEVWSFLNTEVRSDLLL
jgi:hypothetical protein